MQSFLFIGVGGSGGKTLAYLWRSLERRLSAAGWTDSVPPIWQFLHLDPKSQNDSPGRDIPILPVGAVTYVNLADQPLPYQDYDDELVSPAYLEGFAGWRPPSPGSIEPPYLGAGQRRAVGRVISVHALGRIRDAIAKAATAMQDQHAEGTRAALRNRLRVPLHYAPDHTCHVVVVGSLAGGSGSGVFLDVVHVVRSMAGQIDYSAGDPLTVLYTSELFKFLPQEFRRGINSNTLAATSELIAASEGNLDPRSASLLQRSGGPLPREGQRRTGRTTAIVGLSNGVVQMRSETDVYRAVGTLLAGSLTDYELQQTLSSFIVNTNGAPYSDTWTLSKHALPEAQGNVVNPVGALGYASYGLGRNLFAQYTSERIAKLSLDRLLWGHRRVQQAGEQISDERLIQRAADARDDEFFDNTGLHEKGREHNQVLVALRHGATVDGFLDEARNAILERLRRQPAGLPAAEVQGMVEKEYDASSGSVRAKVDADREERARRWSIEVRKKLVDAVVFEIGTYGFPTTIELLERLDAQLRDAIAELEGYRADYGKESAGLLEGAKAVFVQLRDKITTNHDSVTTSVGKRRDALKKVVEGDLFTFAAAQLTDIRQNLLPPLRAAVKSAAVSLTRLATEPGPDRDKFDQWSDTSVPPHLQPAPNEYLLEPIETFEASLEALLTRVYADAASAIDRAIGEAIVGDWPTAEDPTHRVDLIRTVKKWSPADSRARASTDETPGAAEFSFYLDADALLSRTQDWVQRRSDISTYVSESLADYLAPSNEDSTARADAFERAVRGAITASRPLVRINGSLDTRIHSSPTSVVNFFGRFPVKPETGTPLFERVKAALLDAKLDQLGDEAAIEALCDPTSTAGDVDIASFTGSTRHPVIFGSLFEPIAEDWKATAGKPLGEQAQFWSFRRAAVLPDFVPLPVVLQEGLIRGWFTAGFLGRLSDLALNDRPVMVLTEEGWLAFPWPYLGGPERDRVMVLHRVLESYPVALLDLAQGTEATLAAYEALLDLAKDGVGGVLTTYTALNAALQSWIDSGEAPSGAETPLETVAGPAGQTGSPLDRAKALSGAFHRVLKQYAEVPKPSITRVGKELTLDKRWEIAPLVERALTPVAQLLDAASSGPANDPADF